MDKEEKVPERINASAVVFGGIIDLGPKAWNNQALQP